ncbi:MAG: hypothetical protein ABI240_18180 [Sphingomonas sp.]
MKNPAIATILLPVLLCACGRAAPQNDTTPAPVAEGNYLEQIEALPSGQRDMVFMRAIQDSNVPCQHVTGSSIHAKVRDRPTWVAHCVEGLDWILTLEPGGMIHVVNPEQIGETPPPPVANAVANRQ